MQPSNTINNPEPETEPVVTPEAQNETPGQATGVIQSSKEPQTQPTKNKRWIFLVTIVIVLLIAGIIFALKKPVSKKTSSQTNTTSSSTASSAKGTPLPKELQNYAFITLENNKIVVNNLDGTNRVSKDASGINVLDGSAGKYVLGHQRVGTSDSDKDTYYLIDVTGALHKIVGFNPQFGNKPLLIASPDSSKLYYVQLIGASGTKFNVYEYDIASDKTRVVIGGVSTPSPQTPVLPLAIFTKDNLLFLRSDDISSTKTTLSNGQKIGNGVYALDLSSLKIAQSYEGAFNISQNLKYSYSTGTSTGTPARLIDVQSGKDLSLPAAPANGNWFLVATEFLGTDNWIVLSLGSLDHGFYLYNVGSGKLVDSDLDGTTRWVGPGLFSTSKGVFSVASNDFIYTLPFKTTDTFKTDSGFFLPAK